MNEIEKVSKKLFLFVVYFIVCVCRLLVVVAFYFDYIVGDTVIYIFYSLFVFN